MSKATDELDQRIASAMAALHGARAAAWHSPCARNILTEEMCENTVNSLLESRFELQRQAVTT